MSLSPTLPISLYFTVSFTPSSPPVSLFLTLYPSLSICLFTCLSSSFHSFKSTSLSSSLSNCPSLPFLLVFLPVYLSHTSPSTYLSIHYFFSFLSLSTCFFISFQSTWLSLPHSLPVCLFLSLFLSLPVCLTLFSSLPSSLPVSLFNCLPRFPLFLSPSHFTHRSLYSSSPVSSSSCLFLSFLYLFLFFYMSLSPTLFNCLSSFLFSSFSVSYLHLRPALCPQICWIVCDKGKCVSQLITELEQ